MEKAAELLSVFANAHRLVILKLLLDNEMSVTHLSETVGLSQSALSQHLAKLRSMKLVSTRRDAQVIYYSSHSRRVRLVLDLVAAFEDNPVSDSARKVA